MNTTFPPMFAARLKQARLARGLTHDDVAAAMGVNRVTVSGWESKSRPRGEEALHALAALLGITVGWLVGDPDAPEPDWEGDGWSAAHPDLARRPRRTPAPGARRRADADAMWAMMQKLASAVDAATETAREAAASSRASSETAKLAVERLVGQDSRPAAGAPGR